LASDNQERHIVYSGDAKKSVYSFFINLVSVPFQSLKNVALGRGTSSSPTPSDNSGLAVDGNASTLYWQHTCSYSVRGVAPWWEVMFDTTYDIWAIIVTHFKIRKQCSQGACIDINM